MIKRGCALHKKWIKDVIKRDGFLCQWCHKEKNLVAHHIMEWDKYPELRLEISNGLTLCRSCHMRHHKNSKGHKQTPWNKGIKTGVGGMKGKKLTESHKLKLRLKKIGKKLTDEHRKKLINCKSEKSKLENRLRCKGKTWIICKETGKRLWIDLQME
jgi:hypothetical protein